MTESRGGKAYDSRFGQRMRGTGIFAELIRKRFTAASKRLGFPGMPELDCKLFRPAKGEIAQMTLF